jgi:hypothetical protein
LREGRCADEHTEWDLDDGAEHLEEVGGPSTESAPTISVIPMRPAAPGTSIQNVGRYMTSDGGPQRARSIASAAGVMASAPKNADSCASNATADSHWAP